MKINNIKVFGNEFAYDNCHKIYILEDESDKKEAIDNGYDIYNICEIENIYNKSCYLKFIDNWKLNKVYAQQFETATFKYENIAELEK